MPTTMLHEPKKTPRQRVVKKKPPRPHIEALVYEKINGIPIYYHETQAGGGNHGKQLSASIIDQPDYPVFDSASSGGLRSPHE